MAGIDFESELNPEQRQAALAPDGPVLVLAAAGTGKTRTLVYRVAHLVERGIRPDRILLLTFTNKAAREMMDRARTLVSGGVSGLWGGTFHHMANRILRRHAGALGYRNDFSILDRDDSESLIKACVKECKLGGKEFPKPDVLMSLFGTAANTEKAMPDVVEARFEEDPALCEQVVRVHRGYEERKRANGAMDFDDLLVHCLRLFREGLGGVERYTEQFQHVLVDEYQDTNTIQAELVDRLAGRHKNLLVVGDDFQSIYSWRGADFRNIMSFGERWPGAQIYKLETNYRSVPEILTVANACIAHNHGQYTKTLRATRETHRKPVLAKARDGQEQARYVVEHIRNLRRSGYKYSEMAILYRAHFHAMEVQLALTRERIPFAITSGLRFFEQAHIKDVCCVLRLLENPVDEVAFDRLLQMLPGVGARTAEKLWKQLGRQCALREPLQRMNLSEGLPAAARAVWSSIEPVLLAYAEEGLQEDPGELIQRFTKVFYERHAGQIFEDAERRIDDVRELILYTADFENTQTFLSDVALLTNLDAEDAAQDGLAKDMIRLSTVHQAKGLEWPAVMILWLTDNMFPSSRSISESTDGDAEERRLFYVAVTRAKDELCLCVPELRRNKDGSVIPCPPSRFVQEIPPGLLRQDRATLY